MSPQQISAVQGLVLAIIGALVAAGVIDPGLSDTLTGVLAAVITAVAAFLVKRPRDHT